MKILIIHGWGCSSKLYEKLAKDLEASKNIQCFFFELPGFGDTKANVYNDIINSYVNQLIEFVNKNSIDIVIAHSLGGNITLKSLANIKIEKLILLSPLYLNIRLLKIVKFIKPIAIFFKSILDKKNIITDYILKLFLLIAINSWNKISNQVIVDIRKCNNKVAIELLDEMSYENWRFQGKLKCQIVLITSENDRVISYKNMEQLKKDIPQIKHYQIKKIGHTAVLEDYNQLLKIIMDELNYD